MELGPSEHVAEGMLAAQGKASGSFAAVVSARGETAGPAAEGGDVVELASIAEVHQEAVHTAHFHLAHRVESVAVATARPKHCQHRLAGADFLSAVYSEPRGPGVVEPVEESATAVHTERHFVRCRLVAEAEAWATEREIEGSDSAGETERGQLVAEASMVCFAGLLRSVSCGGTRWWCFWHSTRLVVVRSGAAIIEEAQGPAVAVEVPPGLGSGLAQD